MYLSTNIHGHLPHFPWPGDCSHRLADLPVGKPALKNAKFVFQ